MNKPLASAITALVTLSLPAMDTSPLTETDFGTFSGHLQLISMHRDYEGVGSGNSTTPAIKLDFQSKSLDGFSVNLSYIYGDVVHTGGGRFGGDNNGERLLYNGRVNVLNEANIQYAYSGGGEKPVVLVKAGRQVNNGEVFRADPFRHKPRALEGVTVRARAVDGLDITAGYVNRLSNVWDADDISRWLTYEYRDIEEILLGRGGSGLDYGTRGLAWIEGACTGLENLTLAPYFVFADDISRVFGLRAQYTLNADTTVTAYLRSEEAVGTLERLDDYDASMYGLSVSHRISSTTLEAGYLGVGSDGLLFEELGTGINHPLGSSLMIYTSHFNGGADTLYLKAVAKINKTILYGLYHCTWHDTLPFDAWELDVVAKQSFTEALSVAVKVGIGRRDGKDGTADTDAQDARLFVTYTF